MNGLESFIPIILIFVIMYFLLIRPQQKKIKEHKNMVDNLRRGDQVLTQGGIIGKKSGTPPVSGPTPHGLPYETKGVKKL